MRFEGFGKRQSRFSVSIKCWALARCSRRVNVVVDIAHSKKWDVASGRRMGNGCAPPGKGSGIKQGTLVPSQVLT
ncbi:hypothetical protein KCP78_21075 [Salmonella enterica subsp. enterica]|nr:hypothetical protein KCP78_21075 [Salmonella enterica subsp. enterica]